MQVVIDIDDNLYTRLFDNGVDNYDDAVDMAKAIRKGTPLPKGHGRLIDADKLEPRDISPEPWYSPMWGFELVDIEDAPTIIETDKAESEVEE